MLQDAFVFPVSFAQERLWFLNRLQPGSSSHNVNRCIRLFGRLSAATLEQSCAEIVRRHAALRTTFSTVAGEPVQVITPALSLPFRLLDLQELPVSEREAQALRLITEEAFKPFDLVQGPLFRIKVLRLAEDDHILLLTMHHIISDGWSMDVFLNELSTLYAAFKADQASPLPQLPIQCADHAVWQREWLQGDVLGGQLAYWKRQLAGATPPAELPADRPRKAGLPQQGAMHSALIPDALLSQLETLSHRESVTLFMVLLAAFQVLLQRLTGTRETYLGTPVAGRNRTEVEPLIGCFVNTLVLRTDLSGNPTFSELLARVRTVALGAYTHQDLPFERLVQELHPTRDLSRTPFFQVLFNGASVGRQELNLPGIATQRLWLQEMPTGFDLTVYVREQREGTSLQLLYNTELYGHQRMAQMLDQYLYLLEQVAAWPHSPIQSYSLVTASARSMLPDPSAVLAEPPQELVADMIAKWAARAPGYPAIRQGSRNWSYHELASGATALATELQNRGLCRGTVIAVRGGPSFGLIASMLGVFLSGGILLALDPELPDRRQQSLVQQAGTKGILLVDNGHPGTGWWQEETSLLSLGVDPATARLEGMLSAAEAVRDALPTVAPDDPAYVFFTSGTTGMPKGVLGCHKGLSHFLTWQRDTFAIGPGDLAAQLTTLSFDVVLRDIFTPLISGATLCLRDRSQDPGPEATIRWLAREQITMLHTVPTLAKFWLSRAPAGISLPRLRWVFFAGEPLTDVLVHQWRAAFGNAAQLINLYGPTETTMTKCFYRVPAEPLPGVQPIGRPLPQTQALVLTEEDQLCGIGETGQIVVRTPFRTLGYIDAPQAEQGGFVRNPNSHDPADLLYRTGDLGCYRPDGSLDILGRLDDQVKIRGVRIQPAEVTATLAQCSGVQDCIVIGKKDGRDEPYLAAYVVSSGDESVQPSHLRSCLSAQLPAALVPEVFIFLDHLPMTARGKVDLEALPQPDRSEQVAKQNYIAPQTPVEEVVAEIFTDVLGCDQVGAGDSFFALGGHSLLAMQIIFRINDALQADLPLASIFMTPTVAELSQTIQAHQPQAEAIARALLKVKRMSAEERQRLLGQKRSEQGPAAVPPVMAAGTANSNSEATRPTALVDAGRHAISGSKQELLEKRLRRALDGQGHLLSIPKRAMPEVTPLSFAQERMWFLSQLQTADVGYNRPVALRISGHLDIGTLERSLTEITRRHEVLRASFSQLDGRPVQTIVPPSAVALEVIDLTSLPQSERAHEARCLAEGIAKCPIDLEQGPLFRSTLLRLGDRDHVLIAVAHHIAFDAWSAGIFQRELPAIYAAFHTGRPSPLADLPIQYADFAAWQRQRLQWGEFEQELSYWRKQLAGAPAATELPADHPRPAVRTHRGASVAFLLPAGITARLAELGQGQAATLFMVLLAAFKVLLHRLTGQDDIVVGTPIAGRNWPETEGLIGIFLNNLALRTDLSGDLTFLELLGRVRETALGAFDHQDLPFEVLLEELKLRRDPSRTPIFQTYFNMILLDALQQDSSGLRFEEFELDVNHANFDLTVYVRHVNEGIQVSFAYSKEIFEASTMSRMLCHLQSLLQSIADRPDLPISRLSILSHSELHEILVDWNSTQTEYQRDRCFQQLFEDQVDQAPDRIAVSCSGAQETYGQLNAGANRLAHLLVERGIGPDRVVAVLAERGISLLTALIAILKAGGAYLPLDPRYPAQRLYQVLQQSRPTLVLCEERFLPALSEAAQPFPPEAGHQILILDRLSLPSETRNLPARSAHSDLAYVIFTSGSTGQPKGAMIEHLGMLNHVLAKISDLDLTDADVVAQTASQAFDISVWQLLAVLLVGGQVAIFPDEVAYDPKLLLQHLSLQRISIFETVPSLLRPMLDAAAEPGTSPSDLPGLRWLISTGEALPPTLARHWSRAFPGIPILNAYGPTECSDAVTHFPIHQPPLADVTNMPIGRPIANMRTYILDQHLQPVPIGIPGELYIGGAGVGRGYLNDPVRSAEVFGPDPFSKDSHNRLYRTGDLARYLPDGNIQFLGRRDSQVKVRGFRIELGEIETLLGTHPDVCEAVVQVKGRPCEGDPLVAYLVLEDEAELAPGDLRAFLRSTLPDYMTPSIFVVLETLPLTSNGKINRQALPEPELPQYLPDKAGAAPTTPVEEVLASIFCDVLDLDQVGIHDSFFDLGGHSLQAMRVVTHVRGILRTQVSIEAIFEAPTVAELSEALVRDEGQAGLVEGLAKLWQQVRDMVPHEVAGSLIDSGQEETRNG